MILYCLACYILMPYLIVYEGEKKGRTEYSAEEIKEITFAPLIITFALVMVVVFHVSWILNRNLPK